MKFHIFIYVFLQYGLDVSACTQIYDPISLDPLKNIFFSFFFFYIFIYNHFYSSVNFSVFHCMASTIYILHCLYGCLIIMSPIPIPLMSFLLYYVHCFFLVYYLFSLWSDEGTPLVPKCVALTHF